MDAITHWRTSSRSNGQGGMCVEVGWRKSSYSASRNGCVEVSTGIEVVGVRDTKDRDGGTLMFQPQAWALFLRSLKADLLG
ncbi:DUF397 domain-containing protein [Saccharopolyspora sp. NPDC002376]